MAIASKEAPDRIRERSATASLSVGTAIRRRPRRAGCERTDAAVARQDARRMSGKSFHFMTNAFPERQVHINQAQHRDQCLTCPSRLRQSCLAADYANYADWHGFIGVFVRANPRNPRNPRLSAFDGAVLTAVRCTLNRPVF